MKKIVSEQLKKLGVPVNLMGYYYLREAIMLVIKDKSYLNEIMKKLYPGVAERFNTTPEKAERAIRNAITKATIEGYKKEWDVIQLKKGDNAFSKPKNSEFIATVADYISLNYEA